MKGSRGVTFTDLLVGVILLSMAFGVWVMIPRTRNTIEVTDAQEAAVLAEMIATTNRMYSLDYSGRWAVGQLTNSCNRGSCGNGRGGMHPSCDLVVCDYLARHDWDSKRYKFYALDGAAAPAMANPCGSFAAARSWAACAVRKTAADGDKSAPRVSSGWGYAVATDGEVFQSQAGTGAYPTPHPRAQ